MPRRADPRGLERRRRRGVRMLIEGKPPDEVARSLSVSRVAVQKWWKAYQEGGWSALRRHRARTGRRDTAGEVRWALDCIENACRIDKVRFELWSSSELAFMLEQLLECRISSGAVRLMRSNLGLPARPRGTVGGPEHAELEGWMRARWPELKRRLRRELSRKRGSS